MNQPAPASSVPLTRKQQDLVIAVEPMVKKMLRKLERMFPRASPEDLRQTVWLNVTEAASRHDLSPDDFEAVAWKRVFGELVDTFTLEARQNPLFMARRAFKNPDLQLKNLNEPFLSEDDLLSGLRVACHEGTFRMFFGATFETWRMQGEQGTVDHLIRLKAFSALQSAFTSLTPTEWDLLDRYYIKCCSWPFVAAALGIGERQVMRRAEEIREKLKRELLIRGVRSPPPEQR